MWGKGAFLKHLRRELPGWIENGWVSAEGGEAILKHHERGHDNASLMTAAFGVLGVLLLLSGVITFFAANWAEMTKLTKLLVLFGAMLGAYALSLRPLSREAYPRLWASMLLLGAGMFGANIMLIAQIYHIESHYPNGVLFWAFGALALAWVAPAQAVMVMALALGLLWTGMETFGFDHLNLPFLGLLLVALPRIAMQGWRWAAHVAGLGLLLWSLFAYFEATGYGENADRLFVTELMFIAYLALFLAGLLLQHAARLRAWAPLAQQYAVFGALGFFCLLTSPYLHSGRGWWGGNRIREAFASGEIVSIVIALAVLTALAVWHYRVSGREQQPEFFRWARWLLAGCIALLLGTLAIGGEAGGYFAIAFNLYFFAGLVWLIAAGMHMHNRVLVNLAFLFFAITLIARYFDTFWTMMNRSFFFMAGGLLLLGLGFVLEKQRRGITRRMNREETAGGVA